MSRRKSVNKNKSKANCIECKMPVLDSEDAFQCDKCDKLLHSVCTKLNKKQLDKFVKDSTLEYKCHLCVPGKSNNNSTVETQLNVITTKLNQLDEIKESMRFMSAQYDDILKGVSTNKKMIDTLQKENKHLRIEVKELKTSLKYLHDAKVQNDCVINGVTVIDESVSPLVAVLDIAKKIGVDICEDWIDDVYFVNQRKSMPNTEIKRSIVVKFINKKSKQLFMSKKSTLRKNDDLKNVYINDFLSKQTVQIFNHAKTMKAVGFKFVYSRNGMIIARKNENSKPIRINSMDDVDKILLNLSGGSKRAHSDVFTVETSDDENDINDDGD